MNEGVLSVFVLAYGFFQLREHVGRAGRADSRRWWGRSMVWDLGRRLFFIRGVVDPPCEPDQCSIFRFLQPVTERHVVPGEREKRSVMPFCEKRSVSCPFARKRLVPCLSWFQCHAHPPSATRHRSCRRFTSSCSRRRRNRAKCRQPNGKGSVDSGYGRRGARVAFSKRNGKGKGFVKKT